MDARQMEDYHFARVDGDAGGPLVFAFHGTGGDEWQLIDLAKSVAPGATVISPRGDVSEFGANRFFKRRAEGVYDMDDLARATKKMAAFVREQKGDAREVYAIGYSNGANILASVLFAEPGLFDRVALMHPLIPFQPQINGSLQGKRILITAGRRDPICTPTETSRLDAWLRDAGGDVTLAWHDGGHELRETEIDAARALFQNAAQAPQGALEVKLQETGPKGRYSIDLGGSEAEMTFVRSGADSIIIDHTFVPPAARGRGIALQMVERAVADARAAGTKILPLCPYAAAEFRRHPEWADVLKR